MQSALFNSQTEFLASYRLYFSILRTCQLLVKLPLVQTIPFASTSYFSRFCGETSNIKYHVDMSIPHAWPDDHVAEIDLIGGVEAAGRAM